MGQAVGDASKALIVSGGDLLAQIGNKMLRALFGEKLTGFIRHVGLVTEPLYFVPLAFGHRGFGGLHGLLLCLLNPNQHRAFQFDFDHRDTPQKPEPMEWTSRFD